MKKVIVIEDQTIVRDLICQLVEGYDHMKLIAQSGEAPRAINNASTISLIW